MSKKISLKKRIGLLTLAGVLTAAPAVSATPVFANEASVSWEKVEQGIDDNNEYAYKKSDGTYKKDSTMSSAVIKQFNGSKYGYILNGKVSLVTYGLYDWPFSTYYIDGGWVNTATKGTTWVDNQKWYFSIANGKRVYTDNGTVIAGSHTTNSGTYYYMNNGWYDGGYNGLAENENGIWYVENGQINFSKTSVVSDNIGLVGENEKVYVEKGKFTTSTGLYNDATAWYYVKNGIVDTSYTGLAANSNNKWYYVENGCVNFSFTGTADNENGTWYIKNGELDTSFSGSFNNIEFENGKAV